MGGADGFIRQAGDAERMWFAGGGVMRWLATGTETGGAFMLVEDRMQRGKVTPLHTHPQDELIYVLEGELLVDADGRRDTVGAGGVFCAPRGVPHAFMVTSETARVLGLQVPGTGESFYRDAGEPAEGDDDDRPPDWARLRAAAARSDSIEILGPAPFDTTAAMAAD